MAASRLNALARTLIGPGSSAAASRVSSSQVLGRVPSSSRIHHQIHSSRMSSSSAAAAAAAAEPRKFEWLVVVPDKPGMLAKRLEVRPQHFAGLEAAKASGLFKMGGAVLEEPPADDDVSSLKFSGSTIIVVAESRQEVVDLLKNDVYVTSGVWDLEKAMIWPTKIAFRFP